LELLNYLNRVRWPPTSSNFTFEAPKTSIFSGQTPHQKAEPKAALREAFALAINEIGLEAFKRTSWFGSNDPAFKSAKVDLKQAA